MLISVWILACACGAYLTFCISFPHYSWNCRASDNREVSSSGSWLLDRQHIKKRRRDRTRLRSVSVNNVSTSARTRPLHSFQKRKLYRMHGACHWNQQVGPCLSVWERKPESSYLSQHVSCLVCQRNSACCASYLLRSGTIECVRHWYWICLQELRVNELNIKIKDKSESCLSNQFVVWLSLKSLYNLRDNLRVLWEALLLRRQATV